MKNILIDWSPEAEDWLDNQIAYLEENNFQHTLKTLAKDIDKKLNQLSKQPEIGRLTPNQSDMRFVKIGKNINLYYQYNGQKIQLLEFFDTRQDPSKQPF